MTFIANFYEWAVENAALAILAVFFAVAILAIAFALAPFMAKAALVGLVFVGVIYMGVEVMFN